MVNGMYSKIVINYTGNLFWLGIDAICPHFSLIFVVPYVFSC